MEKSSSSQIYGLRVRGPWLLPGPSVPIAGDPDVEFFQGSPDVFSEVPRPPANPQPRDWFHKSQLRDGSTYLRWTDLFDFVISPDGRRIACRPLTHASQQSFETYLLSQVLSFSLLKQGLEPIHATAAVVEGGAVAFLGDCGFGKSTMGAEFLRAGYKLLTDDVLVLRHSGKGYSASPGPPRVKLFPQIAKKLLGQRVGGVPMNPLTPKLIVRLGASEYHDRAVPLRALYVLMPKLANGAPRSRISLRSTSRRNAALKLLGSTFNDMVLEPERLKLQLRHAAEVAASIPVKLLSYPRRLQALSAVRGRVLADLARNGR